MQIKKIRDFFEKLPKPILTFIAFLLVLAIGDLDFITGYDVSVSVLYLIPIILIAWFEGGVPATIISIFSAITWAIADLEAGNIYSHVGIAVRNAMIVLALFLIVTYFVTFIKKRKY